MLVLDAGGEGRVRYSPHRPSSVCMGRMLRAVLYDPEAELEPDDGGVPYPAGGVPVWEPDPLPMSGQLWVEPEPELEPDPELLPDPELVLPDDPELVLLDPEFPVLVLVEGVLVEELDVELDPELPVVLEVVAALATKALPATRPDVSAPMARTLRKRICMGGLPFHVVCCAARSGRRSKIAPRTLVRQQSDIGVCEEQCGECVTIHRKGGIKRVRVPALTGNVYRALRPLKVRDMRPELRQPPSRAAAFAHAADRARSPSAPRKPVHQPRSAAQSPCSTPRATHHAALLAGSRPATSATSWARSARSDGTGTTTVQSSPTWVSSGHGSQAKSP